MLVNGIRKGEFIRNEPQAIFTASTQSRIELSRNYHSMRIDCQLTIEHTNGASASFLSDNFANLINSIQIVANGNRTLKHVAVKKLVWNGLYHKGKAMQNSAVTTVGAQTAIINFSVDFSMRGMERPEDTIENTSLYTTLDMLIDWASVASVGTDIVIDSAVLKTTSHQLIGYSRNVNELIKHNIETQLAEEITSTTTEYQISLPTEKVYRKLLISATVDGIRSNAVINSIKLKSGTTVFAEISADMLRASNIDRSGILTESDVTGLLLLDLVARGRYSDALDTRVEFNSLELILNVTKQSGTNMVTVYSDVLDVETSFEVKG